MDTPLESQTNESQTNESTKKDFLLDEGFLNSMKSATKSFLESTSGISEDSKNILDINLEKAFKMAGSIFGEMIKYKDKPYLSTATMSVYFQVLTSITTESHSEFTDHVQNAATKICEMLKTNTLEELLSNSDFKCNMFELVVNYRRLQIDAFKTKIAQIEGELLNINSDTTVDWLLNDFYSMNKTKK